MNTVVFKACYQKAFNENKNFAKPEYIQKATIFKIMFLKFN